MPHGTLDGTPPPFFRQGPSALSKLIFFSALALFLMVADARFPVAQHLRTSVATLLYPLQWLAMRPVALAQDAGHYFESLKDSQASAASAHQKLAVQSLRAGQVEQLLAENSRLRQLMDLRERVNTPAQAAQVLYDAADPYTRKIIIDKGAVNNVVEGSPVLDENGVLGQVTQVYPLVSEVTLVTDRDQAIPVLNTRTGARGVAFGDPTSRGGALELRFIAAHEDILAGDLLTTSGVDGVYPPGLPVARVEKVEPRADSAFVRITCKPLALVGGVVHVMVFEPAANQMAPRPTPVVPGAKEKKGRSK